MNIPQTPIPAPKMPYAPRPSNCPAHVAWGDEVDRLIPEMAAALAHRCQPDKIILFGSRARGEQRADSDVDLLVVMPSLPSDPYERRQAQVRVGASILDIRRCPTDVLVSTQDRLDDLVNARFHWCAHYDAITQGVTLYDKSG